MSEQRPNPVCFHYPLGTDRCLHCEIERLRAALESVPCSCDARENPEWEHEKTCAVYIADKALNRPVEAETATPGPGAEQLAGCGNWKPKHDIGPYCANCGFHESEHRNLLGDRVERLTRENAVLAHAVEIHRANTEHARQDEHRNVSRAYAEIDRLRAALEQIRRLHRKGRLDGVLAAFIARGALRGADETATMSAGMLDTAYAEIDRLRAALKNIAQGRVGDQLIMNAAEYAKAQLAFKTNEVQK